MAPASVAATAASPQEAPTAAIRLAQPGAGPAGAAHPAPGAAAPAQGRYGRPLRVTGVQHPTPALSCAVVRDRRGIQVSAPYADPVLEGESLLPVPPVTQLWVLLYAQIHQADDADMRNVLLGHRAAVAQHNRWGDGKGRGRAGVDHATATWSNAEVYELLGLLALHSDTPLSCVTVETLPSDVPVADPVGAGLGYERFLRTSPLTAVPELC